MIIPRSFYAKDTLIVAEKLLGCTIHADRDGVITAARIIETEAYCGTADLACHASRGKTPRTEVMFGEPGFAYVYMIYGMYFCLNFVTEKEGNACAVLLRGIETTDGRKIYGPGKSCRYLKIDKSFNRLDLCSKETIWLERGAKHKVMFKTDRRVGIDYAGDWKDKQWRFIML